MRMPRKWKNHCKAICNTCYNMMKQILRNKRLLPRILVLSVIIMMASSIYLTPSSIKTHVKVEPEKSTSVPVKNNIKGILENKTVSNDTEKVFETSRLSRYSQKHCNKSKAEYLFEQKSNYAISVWKTTNNSLRYWENKYKKRVVIMTPISNNADQLLSYFQLVCSLSYPHRLISLVLGEDSSMDHTFEEAVKLSRKFAADFHSIKVYHFNITMTDKFKVEHHVPEFQLIRRAHLAKARNKILKKGLQPEHDYVLWIDSDVSYVPHDIIQHLMYDNKDVIVPSCMWKNGNKYDTYDRNTWQETEKSLEFLRNQSSTTLMLEGYSNSLRLYLYDITNQGFVVKLDGVGGCILMVKAQCFREGLNFPETIYDNHIETEGLAKMALRMKFGVYGLPFVKVVH